MQKKIVQRSFDKGISLTGIPLLDRLYNARGVSDIGQLNYSLANMLNPQGLYQIDIAIELLINALKQQTKIIIVGDFDTDGATSTAVAMRCLHDFGFQQVSYIIPDRFSQGYGLSPAIVELLISAGAELVITVDNGISSNLSVDLLKQQGIQVLITDHHLAPAILPNADAIVNPNQPNCQFTSKNLAGVGVIFYVMLALRSALREQGFFTLQTQPNLTKVIDLVALGTVADVVPLDYNNRIIVSNGLKRIRQEACCVGIKALLQVAQRDLTQISAEDLGFSVAPRLNAAGRLDNMTIGVELLLTDDFNQAMQYASQLDLLNKMRKDIEVSMQHEAVNTIQANLITQQELPAAIVIYQQDWHQGVLGIVSARIKDKFYRPVITFTDDKDDIIKGSARSINGIHIKDILTEVDSLYPNLLINYGGHALAAGLSLYKENLAQFDTALQRVLQPKMHADILANILYTDGTLTAIDFSLEVANLIKDAGPWGQNFPEPCFDGNFIVRQQKILAGKHLKLVLQPTFVDDTQPVFIDAIYFNAELRKIPTNLHKVYIAYKLNINQYNHQINLQLLINHLEII